MGADKIPSWEELWKEEDGVMYAIQNINTGKFVCGTDYRFHPPHQRTSKSEMLTYSTLAEVSHAFWVKRKCGKNYRIVKLKKPEVEKTFDYYETKKFI